MSEIEHQKPDRIPKSDSFWEDTLSLWYTQGLPSTIPIYEFFDFDIITLSTDAFPRFNPKLLKQEIKKGETYITFKDRMGYVCTKIKGKSRTLDCLSYPIPDQKVWSEVKRMFKRNPHEKARIDDRIFPFRLDDGPTWQQARKKYQSFREKDFYLLAGTYGPHEAAWRFHGFADTLMDLIDKPDFIEEIAANYIDFLIKL